MRSALPVSSIAIALVALTAGCGQSSSSATATPGGGEYLAVSAKSSLEAARGKSRKVLRFRSRPDLRPPSVKVRRRSRRAAPGHVFVAPLNGPGGNGPMILDERGELVWFHPLRTKTAMDFRVQTYRGRPVLTWWQGNFVRGWGQGEYLVADGSYHLVARVRAANGYRGDHHDFTLTPQGTALFTVYRPVRRNLSGVGGARRGIVMDGVLQEVDVETGRLLFEWHSIDRVGLAESYKSVPDRGREPWDYFHINSADVDADGNLLISGRNTHAVYKVDRRTGAIIWRLGGKRSDFKLARNARFAWQHDVRPQPGGAISIFDNEASPKMAERSRGIVLALDTRRKRARLMRKYEHPRDLLAINKASMQVLPNGHAFLGWGSEPCFSEFTRRGRLLFDACFPGRAVSYRAYRFPWVGQPTDPPAVAAGRRAGRLTVYASWNGATGVAGWQVLAGPGPDAMAPAATVRRHGFETAIRLRTAAPYVSVQALDGAGHVLATSRATRP